jgi:hypothetical protein
MELEAACSGLGTRDGSAYTPPLAALKELIALVGREPSLMGSAQFLKNSPALFLARLFSP